MVVLPAVENGVVEDAGGIPVENIRQEVEAFAVERGKKEDKQAERQSAGQDTPIRFPDTSEPLPHPFGDDQEITGDETSDYAQKQIDGEILQHEIGRHVEMERGGPSQEDDRSDRAGSGGDEDGNERLHRKVYHQHFQGEYQAGQGRAEDTRDRARRTAGDQKHQVAETHVEEAAHVRPDRRAGKHHGGFGAYRTAETDGDGTSHQRGIHLAAPDASPGAAERLQHAGHAMAYVVLGHIAHIQVRKGNARQRQEKVEIVFLFGRTKVYDELAEIKYHVLEQHGGQAAQQSHHDAEPYHQVAIGQMPAPPTGKTGAVQAVNVQSLLSEKPVHISFL